LKNRSASSAGGVEFVATAPAELDGWSVVCLNRPTIHAPFDCDESKASRAVLPEFDVARTQQLDCLAIPKIHLDDPPLAKQIHRVPRSISLTLRPMWTDVGVLMVACPLVQMLRQVSSEAATPRKPGLANEDDRHAWRATVLAFVKESGEISEVLGHNQSLLQHGEVEHVVIGSAGQLHVVNRYGVMIQCGELLRQSSREHLV
jgi:hypothetical protein